MQTDLENLECIIEKHSQTLSGPSAINSTLVSRNVTILGRRTSVRLEPEMWKALSDVSARENCSIHDISSLVYLKKKSSTSFTAGLRVFLMLYYKAASTQEGHQKAGHGNFQEMKKRARVNTDVNFSRRSQKFEYEMRG